MKEKIIQILKDNYCFEIGPDELDNEIIKQLTKCMKDAFEAGGDFRMACLNLTNGVIDKLEWSETLDFDEFMKNYEK